MNADDFHALYQVLSDPDIMRDAKVLAESGNDCASKFFRKRDTMVRHNLVTMYMVNGTSVNIFQGSGFDMCDEDKAVCKA